MGKSNTAASSWADWRTIDRRVSPTTRVYRALPPDSLPSLCVCSTYLKSTVLHDPVGGLRRSTISGARILHHLHRAHRHARARTMMMRVMSRRISLLVVNAGWWISEGSILTRECSFTTADFQCRTRIMTPVEPVDQEEHGDRLIIFSDGRLSEWVLPLCVDGR